MDHTDSGEGKYVNPIYVVIALAAVFIGVTGLFVWQGNEWYAEYNELAQPVANLGPQTRGSMIVTAASATPGIGGELYDVATNPVGELPDTVPAVPNPVENVYQNPFE
ncbi:MAG: hypothetical protein RL681_655 [Candidatus Parcubacteria bacterium]|jgi:hypothetical protein